MVFSASSVFIRDCGTPLVHVYFLLGPFMYIFPLSIFIFILYPDIARASSSVLHLGYLHSY